MGVPAVGIAVAVTALLVLTGSDGPVVSKPIQRASFSIAITVGVIPVTVLFSYIRRPATVTERTAAVMPFMTPEQER
ncbi:hypothetical protein ACFOZ7_02260 [Natribaculum luteum]|uniref:Uncharacterized protein n=1 Tax=Natribaculum luteum TaxID=1586232 RepID=A0ABD5NUU7_9EURY|nr:hypothetical protein [Natribaculum luteum]